MKKIKWILLAIIGVVIVGGALSFFLYYTNYKKEEKIKLERKELVENIKKNFALQVEVKKDSNLYTKENGKYKSIGKIAAGECLSLKEEKITYKTKYFYIPELDLYIDYKNVGKGGSVVSRDHRYKKYVLFNENIITKDNVRLYRDDKLVYTLNSSIESSIIMKADNGYYIEYYNEMLFVPKEDVEKVVEVQNSNVEVASEVPVTVYHFIYLEGDNTCNEMICHPESQIREQFKYLKDNQYFTLTTTELRLFLEGKIRVPKRSILITIDDGARAEKFIPLLEEYQVNATLFLISSWYPKEKFASSYMEIASHTHNLHTPGVCSGGQGSPLKCLDKEKLLSDLRASRETLDNTEAFCFPFYEFNDYGINALKEAGFKMAFIGGMKKAAVGVDLYKIPRISMNSGTTLAQYIAYVE